MQTERIVRIKHWVGGQHIAHSGFISDWPSYLLVYQKKFSLENNHDDDKVSDPLGFIS
ncbi:MAG: hypothetical protein WBV84_05515 [Nitrososphaeraceae archaeon]